MTDKDKPSSSKNNKLWLLYLILTLGVVVLTALYINFQFSYKFSGISQKISELDSNQEKIISLSRNIVPDQPPVIMQEAKPVEPQHNYCNDLREFIQDYYLMKLSAQKGQDFSGQALNLNQYSIHSPELKGNIENLINLAPENRAPSYFKQNFHNLIRLLYKTQNDSKYFNLRDYIFVRAIGERAINNGGLDGQVFLIEQALEQNNLTKVNEHLQDLQQDVLPLNIYKSEISNQLAIQECFENIENILLDKSNSNIVSK